MTASRRGFLRGLSGALAAEAARGDGEDYWRLVRRQFPLEEDLVYLNAANVCPASRAVMDKHQEFLRDFHANPSRQNCEKYVAMQESLRAKLAALLRVTPDEIAITRNTSESTNIVVSGLDLKAGDEVVLTAHNHPSNLDSWQMRARREGFTVKLVPVELPAPSKQSLLDGFAKAITPRTKVVSFTHLTSTTGILYPAKEIVAMARRVGAWTHVDGAQSFGALDVNLRDIGCDSYSGSAHKWFMGPLEAGMFYARRESHARLWPAIVSAGWSDAVKGARKYEVYGQRDDPRIAAFSAAADFIEMIGIAKVEARTRFLSSYAKGKLAEIGGVKLLTNMEPELSAGVIKFQTGRKKAAEVYQALYAKHRVAGALTEYGDAEGVRFSPHVYNSTADIDRAVDAVRKLLA